MQNTVASLMDDVTDPTDWKDDFEILRNLDASLRCDLCFDIYTSPVSIKSCHHTFCSTCIRTHINQSGNSGSFCPKCRQTKAYDSELIPQPVLEITALEWKKARSFLARLQVEHDQPRQRQTTPQVAESSSSAKRLQSGQNGDHDLEEYVAGTSPRRSKRIKTDGRSTSLVETPAGSRSSPLTIDDDEEEDDHIEGMDDDDDGGSRATGTARTQAMKDDDDEYVDGVQSSRSSPSKRRAHEPPPPPPMDANRELKADDLVQCPICSHKFTVTALNRHLDSAACYPGFPEPSPEDRGLVSKPKKTTTSAWFTHQSSTNATPTSEGSASMTNEKRLVRPQYNLRSERELRKLLEEAGLPTTGDREKLVERHRQWINIWNANLDSTKARRTAGQLRRDLAAWERTRTTAKDHSAHVDKQKTTWVKSNKSQFDELIQKAKAGAMKDRKLRDGVAASSDDTVEAENESGGLGDSESQAEVITSSPVVVDERNAVETNGMDV